MSMAPGKNSPCNCGSGKKFKHCCEGKFAQLSAVPPIEEFNQLVALYNARRYSELENRASLLVGQYPGSGFAWKLLGASLLMQGKHALHAFQKTAELMPNDAEAHFNLGVVQKSINQLDSAVASYRKAIQIKPDYAEAYSNLGNTLRELGQLENALLGYQQATQLQPNFVDTQFNMSNTLKDLGRLEEAVASYRRVIALKPSLSAAHNNLGAVLKELGRFEEAVTSYQRFVQAEPNSAEAHNNLGAALKELGQFDEAAASYLKAIQLKPQYAEAYCNLGNALVKLGKIHDAIAYYHHAISINPSFFDAHFNLGNALQEADQFDSAVLSYGRALEINPNSAGSYYNLGNALLELRKIHGAMINFRRALEIEPDYAGAHFNYAVTLMCLGQSDDALANYRRALELDPDLTKACSSIQFTLSYSARYSSSYRLNEARQYGQMVTRMASMPFTTWQCSRHPERLRVGVVSGDLRNHPVGYFLESLVTQLDGTRIELVAYPTHAKEDALTARIKPHFAAWKSLASLDDEAAARLIHADGVHILLDLSGHTRHNRLPVFAWKPAPVQASWLGYCATTGMTEMDYLLADQVGVPETTGEQFTETIYYLPDTRLCFTPPQSDLPVAPLPALTNGNITFGCFQDLSKVGDDVLAVWGKVLAALPSAKLHMQCAQLSEPTQVIRLTERLQNHGIAPTRFTLHGLAQREAYLVAHKAPTRFTLHGGSAQREAYLAAHADVDLILDTFPYPGGTTTCEALWMGVPTLTLAGNSMLARQGASMLTAAGLEEWVADSEEEYLAKAIALASDLPGLADLRATLRAKVLCSPLFDAGRFAHNFEAALWDMWGKSTR